MMLLKRTNNHLSHKDHTAYASINNNANCMMFFFLDFYVPIQVTRLCKSIVDSNILVMLLAVILMAM